jgi:hypothetical protein
MFGSLAGIIGAPNTLILGGIFCLAGSILFANKLPVIRPIVMPIYKRLGIVHEIISTTENSNSLN